MEMKVIVLRILALHKDAWMISGRITEEIMKTPEVKAIIKEHKKPRREGGDGWSNEKAKKHLLDKYKFSVRSAVFSLRESGHSETVSLKGKSAAFLKNVLAPKAGAKGQEDAAHKITELGLHKHILYSSRKEKPKEKEDVYDPQQ